MEKLNANQISSLSLDHLGLVAAVIHDLDLINKIDKILPLHIEKGVRITMGQRASGMILNALGFVDTRLYMYPEYLADKPVDLLIGEGVKASDFTQDALGRLLDAIHLYGCENFFAKLAYPIAVENNLLGQSIHIDTSSISLEGAYDFSAEELADLPKPPAGSLATPEINYGHSKDHRPDLKQMVINMATTGAAGFPLWMETHSGNASDQKILHEACIRMKAFVTKFDEEREFIYVADSAIYSSCVKQTDHLIWLTRVPERSNYAIDLLQLADENIFWEDYGQGYKACPVGSTYQDIKQIWLIVFSDQAYKREIITFEKKIVKDQSTHEKTLAQLGAQDFQCKVDAEKAAVKLGKYWKHHSLSHKIIEVKKYDKSGRPKATDAPEKIIYKITGTVIQDKEAIELSRRRKGRFILATNDINEDKIAPANMLSCYKEQAATEGGFRFIKGNHFNVSSVLLKNPNRVSALLVIMTLSLMVYAFAQYKLREALKKTNQTIPNQKNKEVNNPTISRVFRLFFGIQLLRIVTSDLEQSMVINLNPVRIKIIKLFGTKAMQIYGLDEKIGDNITK